MFILSDCREAIAETWDLTETSVIKRDRKNKHGGEWSVGDTSQSAHSHWLLQMSAQYSIAVPHTLQDFKI